MRIPRGIGVIGVVAAAAAFAPPIAPGPSAAPDAAPAVRPVVGDPPFVCGAPTVFARPARSDFAPPPLAAQAGAARGPLWYDQNPRLLRADHVGGLAFDDFLVAGDVTALTFERVSRSAENFVVTETWRRTGATSIDGNPISIFNPRWDSATLWDSIGWQRRGFDHPWVGMGTLLVPRPSGTPGAAGGDAPERFFLRVRMAPLNLPPARVTRIDGATQYASHVVNLVMPEFGNRRLSAGDRGFALDEVARRFYAHFRDEYASIAIVPRQPHVVPYDTFHHNVRNPVAGLGLPVFDDSAEYGSAGVLRSVELFPSVSFTSNAASTHAIAHQWVDYWDWARLAGGVDRAGREPGRHTPLLFPGEAYAGAVLDVTRRVAAAGAGSAYTIERTPGPALLHPTTLYRMGLIGPEAVPEILVFRNQGQFDAADAARPDVGTVVQGEVHRVHVNDVLAEHGPRRGPADTSWSRATVVVSRDGLLSPEEMSYWNFFAARHAADAGTTTWEGVPSFREATGGAAPLRTGVTPLRAARITEAVEVRDVPIAAGEFRGVRLDAPVPARIAVGERVTIAGVVTAAGRDDLDWACVVWNRYGSDRTDRREECVPVTGNRFSIPYRFTEGDAGRHQLHVFLYGPDERQVYDASISGITVAAAPPPAADQQRRR